MAGSAWILRPLLPGDILLVLVLSIQSLFPHTYKFLLQTRPEQIYYQSVPWALQGKSKMALSTFLQTLPTSSLHCPANSTVILRLLKSQYSIMPNSSLFRKAILSPPPMPLNHYSFCAQTSSLASILSVLTCAYHLTPGLRQYPSTQAPCLNLLPSHLSSTLFQRDPSQSRVGKSNVL